MKNLTVFYFFIILSYAAIMGFSQIILSNASKQISTNLLKKNIFFSITSSNWLFWGILFYIVALIYWLWILSKVDIRYAYPIASTSVLFASLASSYQMGFFPSLNYWLGLILVIVGLALVVNSKL